MNITYSFKYKGIYVFYLFLIIIIIKIIYSQQKCGMYIHLHFII